MRLAIVVVSLAALLLIGAPPAHAKLCVRIEAPPSAAVGGLVTVRVTTLQPTSWEGLRPVGLTPAPVGRSLQLSLAGPRGTSREVMLRPTEDPAVWSVRLRLRRPGLWTLSVVGWEYAPRACAPPVRVRVR